MMKNMELEKVVNRFINEEAQSSLSSKLFREITLKIYLEHIVPESKILDIGCGTGGIAIPFAMRDCEVDAVDNHEGRLQVLRKNINDLNIKVHHASVFEMDFEKASYDYVTSRQFMSYFEDWKKVLKIKLEYLKPGGLIIYHQHSKENMQLCDKIAMTKENKILVGKGYNNNKRFGASKTEIEKFCKRNKCELVKLIPVSFFLPRALPYKTGLSKEEVKNYEDELNARMENEAIYDFMKWYEFNVMQNMPLELSSSFISVIRK